MTGNAQLLLFVSTSAIPIADVQIGGHRLLMTWKRIAGAAAWSVIALLASFFVVTVAVTAWYSHAYPHDGQGGLAAFVIGLYVAPAFAVAAFLFVFLRGR
jgi:hypothetical protein